MLPRPTRSLPALALAAASIAASPPPSAAAASTYCSSSGDLCYGAFAKQSPVRLRITLFAGYFTDYRLCVTGPAGKRDCRGFRVRRIASGMYESTVRWSRHFPNRGRGTYRVRWSLGDRPLGPTLTFRR